jgi:hypothetical protein
MHRHEETQVPERRGSDLQSPHLHLRMICRHCGFIHSDWLGCGAAMALGEAVKAELVEVPRPVFVPEGGNPPILAAPCFKCGDVTTETQSVYGVGHLACFRDGSKLKIPVFVKSKRRGRK